MSMQETSSIKPYHIRDAACPICNASSKQPEMKIRLFAERERDVDLRPKRYLWAVKDLEWCHPPLYYMWSCPVCRFTAGHSHFTEPAKAHHVDSELFKKRVEQRWHREANLKLAEVLADNANRSYTRTFAAGVGLHLQGIHLLESIEEISTKETLLLGKYYLRTGWLFRDLAESYAAEAGSVHVLLSRVRPLWGEVPASEERCLRRAAELLEQALETSSGIVSTRDEIELILLTARIWMKLGDARRAKNLGLYSRERLAVYEAGIENQGATKAVEDVGEIRRLKLIQDDVLEIISTC